MAKDRNITPEERALFREAVGRVRPLKEGDRADIKSSRPTAPRRQRPLGVESQIDIPDSFSDEYLPLEYSQHGGEAGFVRPGIQQGLLRKLRRGQFAAEAELDLHGLTVAQARTALSTFLQHCCGHGKRHVRIIHGQGNTSHAGRAVLKGKVRLWLQQLDEVLAFCPARPEHGGNGAVYVLLRRNQK